MSKRRGRIPAVNSFQTANPTQLNLSGSILNGLGKERRKGVQDTNGEGTRK